MSTVPKVSQVRRPVTMPDGSMKFEITSTITDKGDLPFADLFVLTITDGADAKNDVLARVATPLDIRQTDPDAPVYVRVVQSDMQVIPPDTFARISNVDDLTALPRDRTFAVRNKRTVYMTSVMTVFYDSLTTADAAYRQIIARLSTLVTEWRATFTPFATNPSQEYNLPTAGISVEDQRKSAYVTARDARIAAEKDRDAAQVASDACVRDCAADKVIYDFLVADVSFLEVAKALVTSLTEASIPPGTPTTTNAKDFVLGHGAYAGDDRTYAALLTSKTTQRDEYEQRVRTCNATCNALAATLLHTQNVVNASRTVEQEALARVYAVCPTFDPTTV